MTTSDKYIVFKRDEWENRDEGLPEEVPDAVVIRRQDVFAPPALDGYANAIAIGAELVRPLGLTEVADRLQGIADYFHEQAVISWDTNRKLPD